MNFGVRVVAGNIAITQIIQVNEKDVGLDFACLLRPDTIGKEAQAGYNSCCSEKDLMP
jgi:hypothetical protein